MRSSISPSPSLSSFLPFENLQSPKKDICNREILQFRFDYESTDSKSDDSITNRPIVNKFFRFENEFQSIDEIDRLKREKEREIGVEYNATQITLGMKIETPGI